jgi:uncharacterized membrane protein YdbT with pleckstrin-like domain
MGLVFGFLGLGFGVYRMSIQAERQRRPERKQISEVVADTIKRTADKFRKQPPPATSDEVAATAWSETKKLGLAASICGFIGAVLGCASWLVAEHRRWTWAALCVGIMALAWTHVVVAVGVAVGIVVFIWLISKLDLG